MTQIRLNLVELEKYEHVPKDLEGSNLIIEGYGEIIRQIELSNSNYYQKQ